MMDDLVRREDVYNILSDWMYDRTDNRTLNEVVGIIPSAQPEPKTDENNHYKTGYNQGFVDACKMYEKKQPEIKTDGDTISRQMAIDAVKKNTFRLTFAEEQNCEGHVAWSANTVYSDVMEGALLELPSAQPERTKRIIGKSRDGMTMWYQCELCNEPVDEKDLFCSGCGRRFENG